MDQGTTVGDVIVTALRREERLRDVPISITAVTSGGLERAGIANLRDLGNITPGLVFTGQAGLGSPTIRGIQSTLGQAGAETPTSIYLDGVYQPNIAANVLDIADIEQVEVLKGPQGTLFGRNATAGAINIRTVDPSFDFRGEATISDGIYFGGGARTSHDVTAKGYVAGPLAGDWLAGSLSGYYEYVQGYLT
ncbi:MAG TPA: TonB-dependent receptor plug domain-containing protein, partial [Methylomirabilota bacterium]|nr:TonB-dependent receptor plug domain-containing protein [Methylomirabilota bacterium]